MQEKKMDKKRALSPEELVKFKLRPEDRPDLSPLELQERRDRVLSYDPGWLPTPEQWQAVERRGQARRQRELTSGKPHK